MKKRFVFFGTPEVARITLVTLYTEGYIPTLVVTAPDAPRGRGMQMTPTPVKEFALQHNIPVTTPEKITPEFIEELKKEQSDFFVVAAYGKILPKALIDLPPLGTLNIHPSLLPKYRGPTPLESVLLSDDKETGVTLMKIDEQVDHGPIIGQQIFPLPENETYKTLSEKSFRTGAFMLVQAIENDVIDPIEQDHHAATFTKKVTKEDGEVTLTEDGWTLWKKFRALSHRPGLYFFTNRNNARVRIKIKTAHFINGQFIIDTVIPENGKEIPFASL